MRKVLWGENKDDYTKMFDLSDQDWRGRILEYGCGATAVNAICHQQGLNVQSYDPLFVEDIAVMKHAILQATQSAINDSKTKHLMQQRQQGIELFLTDFPQGLAEGRYHLFNPQGLPFAKDSFDLALSAYYFFERDQSVVSVQVDNISGLLAVAKELRIFPLSSENQQSLAALGPLLLALQKANYGVEIKESGLHGNVFLRIWALQCELVQA